MRKHSLPKYGRTIKAKLALLGWTQGDLARKLKVSNGTITHYLKGRNTGLEMRARILKVLRLPDDTFDEET